MLLWFWPSFVTGVLPMKCLAVSLLGDGVFDDLAGCGGPTAFI